MKNKVFWKTHVWNSYINTVQLLNKKEEQTKGDVILFDQLKNEKQ